MLILLVVVGAIIGATSFGGFFGSTVTGALLGLLAGLILKQSQRLDAVKNKLTGLQEDLDRV